MFDGVWQPKKVFEMDQIFVDNKVLLIDIVYRHLQKSIFKVL